MIDLRHGDWREVLADVEECDAVICDPPYGGSTHAGVNGYAGRGDLPDGSVRRALVYDHWTHREVEAFVDHWCDRCRGWIACFTSDDLAPHFKDSYRTNGWYAFAPIPVIQPRPRLVGDGPANWTVWLMVARPRTREMATWGCLPGAYWSRTDRTGIVAGAKPLDLTRAIVRDYSRRGDLIVDPCMGGGTTGLAARMEGRRFVGSEMDECTFQGASNRLAFMPAGTGTQPALPWGEA